MNALSHPLLKHLAQQCGIFGEILSKNNTYNDGNIEDIFTLEISFVPYGAGLLYNPCKTKLKHNNDKMNK